MVDRQQQYFQNTHAGDHICSIFKNKAEQFSTLIAFFKKGLDRNEKCIYVMDGTTREEVIHEFEKEGVNLNMYLKSKQFLLLTPAETYLKNNEFVPTLILAYWKFMEQRALDEGYPGVRICGEALWAVDHPEDQDKLMAYEAQVTEAIKQTKITALCLYDETKFEHTVLLESIHTHPGIVIYGVPAQNMYFSPFAHDAEHKLPTSAYTMIRDDLLNKN
jgi:hypothetical protein